MALRYIDRNNELINTAVDVALIIPILKSDSKNDGIDSVDFCIGAFRPVLWTPKRGNWHTTYSIDFTFKI